MVAPVTETDRKSASEGCCSTIGVPRGVMPATAGAALMACMLYFVPAVLAQSDSLGELLVGNAAFGDWRGDAPLVRRKITELPPPYATRSASNPPRMIAKPASAPKVPPGFQAELFASELRDPRVLRVAPNGLPPSAGVRKQMFDEE